MFPNFSKYSLDLSIIFFLSSVCTFAVLAMTKKNNVDVGLINKLENGFVLKSKPRAIRKLPGYFEGKWLIQDRSSQWVAPLLSPIRGDKILDACAAPGTKTTHLAQLIKDDGEILAIDRSDIRLNLLEEKLSLLIKYTGGISVVFKAKPIRNIGTP